jgi:hypothetical protein
VPVVANAAGRGGSKLEGIPRANPQPQRVSHPGRGSRKARRHTFRGHLLPQNLTFPAGTDWLAATGCFAPT